MNKLITGTALALIASAGMAHAGSHSVTACLITKTDTNPFFVKMKEGATAKAEELGIELKTFAGKVDGDHETQVAAIETCIADGAKGFRARCGWCARGGASNQRWMARGGA